MKKTPIFRKILIPLMGLVVVEIFILVFALFGQGLIGQLTENEQDVLKGRVGARKNYLESVMVNDWMNLSSTVAHVTNAAQALMDEGHITLADLDEKSSNSAPLLTQSAQALIDVLRANHVTGAYIIINTDDLKGTLNTGLFEEKPGIYLRDSDPTSIASERNEDITIELSPRDVVQQLRIATGVNWDVRFRFTGEQKHFYEHLYYPYQTAYTMKGYTWQDMGYWCAPKGLTQSENAMVSYSVPLMLADGSVFGVLGTEMSMNYLRSLLPHEELDEEGRGGYFLAQYHVDTGEYSNILGFGDVSGLTPTREGRYRVDGMVHYAYSEPLRLYSSNTPFSGQQWVLVGMLPHDAMHSFTRSLILAAIIAVGISLAVGLAACLLLTYMLQRPVARLAQEMRTEDPAGTIYLSPTGILEIDQMSDEVMRLSRDVMESGRKFSNIIQMASVHLAGFEIDKTQNTLFLTENFFSIFGREDIQQQGMTVEEFKARMEQFRAYVSRSEQALNGSILRLPLENGKQRFVQIRITEDGEGHTYGLAEDVTQALLEKQILKYERDHDSLTNLHNRRAFRRKVQALLEDSADRITIGAMVMIDLDNLKYINDNYGHEYGDRYLKQAASAIEHCMDHNACHARISGDEFNVFIYGYRGRAEIEAQIQRLRHALSEASITLPDGKPQRLRATGGIAWYPIDSASFDDLSKYADYAMYRAKQDSKGDFQHFDMALFQGQDIQRRNSAALTKMVEEQKVFYAFQPIVDVQTGAIFAYEALMRPDVGMYFNVKDAMDTARREGKLSQIEELTWTVGLRDFTALIEKGNIAPDACLFVNSIPTQRLSEEKEQELLSRYGDIGPRLVMELTEDERMDTNIWNEKARKHKAMGGRVALDDYGAGYNSEKALLTLSPDLIKVDLDIVRDIHLDADKRAIVEYIVNYAHTRGKKVIAEGVETADEVRTIVAMGVDYIQGYFFAKPLREPQGISQDGVALLMQLAEQHKK